MQRASYQSLIHFPARELQRLDAGALTVNLDGLPHALGFLPREPVQELHSCERAFLDLSGETTVSRTWKQSPGGEILQDSWTHRAGEQTSWIHYRRDRLTVKKPDYLDGPTLHREPLFSGGYKVPAFGLVHPLGFGACAIQALTTGQYWLVRIRTEDGAPGSVAVCSCPPVRWAFEEILEDCTRVAAFVGPRGQCFRVLETGDPIKTFQVTGPRSKVQFYAPGGYLEINADRVNWRGPTGIGERTFGQAPAATEKRLFYIAGDGAIESVECEGYFNLHDNTQSWTEARPDQLPGEAQWLAVDPHLGLLGAWTDAVAAPVLLAPWFKSSGFPIVFPESGRTLRGTPSFADWLRSAVSGELLAKENAEGRRVAAGRVVASNHAAEVLAHDEYLRGLILQE